MRENLCIALDVSFGLKSRLFVELQVVWVGQ